MHKKNITIKLIEQLSTGKNYLSYLSKENLFECFEIKSNKRIISQINKFISHCQNNFYLAIFLYFFVETYIHILICAKLSL